MSTVHVGSGQGRQHSFFVNDRVYLITMIALCWCGSAQMKTSFVREFLCHLPVALNWQTWYCCHNFGACFIVHAILSVSNVSRLYARLIQSDVRVGGRCKNVYNAVLDSYVRIISVTYIVIQINFNSQTAPWAWVLCRSAWLQTWHCAVTAGIWRDAFCYRRRRSHVFPIRIRNAFSRQ